MEDLDPEGTSGTPLCSGAQRSAVVEAVDGSRVNGIAACQSGGFLVEKSGHLIVVTTTMITHVIRHD